MKSSKMPNAEGKGRVSASVERRASIACPNAFTLTELLVSIVIIAILTALLPSLRLAREQAYGSYKVSSPAKRSAA